MSDFLKGNFKVKKEVKEEEEKENKETSLKKKFKEAAIASIGGSMVFVEETELAWDGEEEESKD